MFGFKNRRAPMFGKLSADDDKDIEIQKPRLENRQGFWSEARLLVRDLIFALMFATLMVVFVIQPVKVEGTSMLTRLHDGDRIFVNKLIYYGMPKLQRGDIVVFWYPNDPSKNYIKRIVGLPGETVEVREGRVVINGVELDEQYLDPHLNVGHMSLQPVLVKDHYYFVMGDNRDNSSDSRYWGLVPEKYIYGKALFRYWPLADASVISHEENYRNIPPSARREGETPEGAEDTDEQ
ncbi:MAG TPA: signal peptidase I [Pyrinomonadaceae bacterium]|nr:signal peptidase I [Pyrinomonadaceae bacterium]